MKVADVIRGARGGKISCRGWQQEAALRMLMNNLDPDVAERPDELVVYGGRGKAEWAVLAGDWGFSPALYTARMTSLDLSARS